MKHTYGLFPRITVEQGVGHAQNGPLGISIDPAWPRYGAALAEERIEFITTWKIIALITLPLMAIAAYFYWPLIFATLLPAALVLRLPQVERYIEIVGHSVYSYTGTVCYSVPTETMINESAESLHSTYSYFKKTPVEQIKQALINRQEKAHSWVFANLPKISRDIKIAKEKFNV